MCTALNREFGGGETEYTQCTEDVGVGGERGGNGSPKARLGGGALKSNLLNCSFTFPQTSLSRHPQTSLQTCYVDPVNRTINHRRLV